MNDNVPLTRTGPTLECDQAAAVSNSGEGEAVKRSSVDYTWSTGWKLTANHSSEIATSIDNHVSAKTTHEYLVRWCRHRQHVQTVRLCELKLHIRLLHPRRLLPRPWLLKGGRVHPAQGAP